MKALPKTIKKEIMQNYLFEDLFKKFAKFFHTAEQSGVS